VDSGLGSAADLRKTLGECIDLARDRPSADGNRRLVYSNNVFKRQILAAYTALSVFDPPKHDIPSLRGGRIYGDFPTAALILRGMYECFLEGRYILMDTDFHNCRDVVIDAAILHAQRERLAMAKLERHRPHLLVSNAMSVLDTAASAMDNEQYSSLPTGVRNYIARATCLPNKAWHGKKLEKLALRAGIQRSHHRSLYKYCSNHAHCNAYSLQQIGSVTSASDVEGELVPGLCAYTIHMLYFAVDLFRAVQQDEGYSVHLSQGLSEEVGDWKEFYAHP